MPGNRQKEPGGNDAIKFSPIDNRAVPDLPINDAGAPGQIYCYDQGIEWQQPLAPAWLRLRNENSRFMICLVSSSHDPLCLAIL